MPLLPSERVSSPPVGHERDARRRRGVGRYTCPTSAPPTAPEVARASKASLIPLPRCRLPFAATTRVSPGECGTDIMAGMCEAAKEAGKRQWSSVSWSGLPGDATMRPRSRARLWANQTGAIAGAATSCRYGVCLRPRCPARSLRENPRNPITARAAGPTPDYVAGQQSLSAALRGEVPWPKEKTA